MKSWEGEMKEGLENEARHCCHCDGLNLLRRLAAGRMHLEPGPVFSLPAVDEEREENGKEEM